jgi:hypothetical protein
MTIAKVELKFAHLSNRDARRETPIEIEDGLRRYETQALGAPWPDRPARQVKVPPRPASRCPADVDPAWDMCDVCGDLLAYCPGWRRRYPEVVEHQARASNQKAMRTR